MAYDNTSGATDWSGEAAADLSSNQYNFVKLDGSGNVALCVANSAGQKPIGVLQNKPTSGQTALVRIIGITKLEAGVSFDEGDLLAASDASSLADNGQAVAADSGDYVCGQAIVAGAADEYITAVINCASLALVA